jgi:hypothetical protein
MSTWSLSPGRSGCQTRRLSRYLIAVTVGCAFLVSVGDVSPASAKPPAPASKRECKLKGGGSIPHDKTIWSKGKEYRCNNGTFEQVATV